MALSRSIRYLHVVSPVCLAALLFGCGKKDSSAEWEEALDASEEGDKPNSKDAGDDDGDDDESATSSGGAQANSSVEDNTTTTAAATSSATGTSDETNDPIDAGTSVTSDETGEESVASTEDPATSTPPNSDAGGATSAGNDTASPGGCEGYLLCETFEDVEVGAIPEGWQLRGENVAVSSDDAHGGQRALKIDAASPGPRQLVRDASVLGSAHWGRVYYRVDLPVPEAFVHSTIVSLSGEATESGAAEFRVVNMNKQDANTEHVGSKHNWAYNVQVTGGEEWVCESGYDNEFDADWHCAEYFLDAGTQTYELYIDDTAADLRAGSCERLELPQEFDELRVGWNYYANASPGFAVYLDDIAFDNERIGCN